MATKIITKYNSTNTSAPVAGDLEVGELALNVNLSNSRLYTKNSSGSIVWLNGGIDNGAISTGVSGALAYYSSAGTSLSDTDDGLGDDGAYWDASNNRLGIGTNTPADTLDVVGGIKVTGKVGISATSGLLIPVGTTAQRSGSATTGEIRFNSTSSDFEGYDGSAWGSLGGSGNITFGIADTNALKVAGGTGSTSNDAQWDKVTLLLQSDATDGSSTFSDASGSSHTITTHGTVTHEDTVKKFGDSSIYINGTQGNYLSVADSSDFSFGDDDFTIEFWHYPTDLDNSYYQGMIVHATSDSGTGMFFTHDSHSTNNGYIRLFVRNSGSDIFTELNSSNNYLSENTWYHLAFVRDGNTVRLYGNGVQLDSASYSGTWPDFTGSFIIGARPGQGGNGVTEGYFEEVRVTKGNCRYPSGTTFSVPTAAFEATSVHSPADNDYAKFTSSGIEGRSYTEVKTDLSLNNVENTAVSTWAGTANITTLGTISTGTWNGTAIADGYIASASTWDAKQDALATNQIIDWTVNSSGNTIHSGNIPVIALTTVQTAANQTAHLALTTQEGDVVVRSDENKSYVRNSGTAGNMTDFTLLETPTDAVLSVAGKTGAVSLVKGDVGLGNVENTALSTWAGSTNVTTLGTVATGTWNGTAIGDSYISSAATWNAKQSALTFGIADTNALKVAGGTGTTSTLDTNLLSYYKMDNDYTDAKGSSDGSSGTFNSDNKKLGTHSALFNNTKSNWSVASLPTGNSARSFSLWVKRIGDSSGGTSEYAYYYGDDSNGQSFTFGYERGNSSYGASFYGTDLDFDVSADTDWHHWALTYDGSGTFKAYQDATLVHTETSLSLNTATGNDLYLGGGEGSSYGGRLFKGYIDELGIWSKELSSSEVTELYNSGSGKGYGSSGFSTAHSPSDNDYAKFTSTGIEGRDASQVKTDLSLNNVENTAVSTWTGSSNITTLGTVATGTWNGTAIADGYIASASTWDAKQSALTFGIADTNALKVAGGVVSTDTHWDKVEVLLQGGTADVSNNTYSLAANDGSSSIPTNSGGKWGDGYYFQDRSNDSFFVNGSNTGWLDFEDKDFTIEFWYKRADSGGTTDWLFAHTNNAGWEHVGIRFDSDDTLRTYFKTYASGQSGSVTSGSSEMWTNTGWEDTNWHHIAMERYGDTVTIYKDGTALSNDLDVGSKYFYTGNNHSDQGKLGIGSNGVYNDNHWADGYMDDFRITIGVARYQGNFSAPTAAFPSTTTAHPTDNDYAKFTTTGIEGRSYAEVKTDLALNNVENTAVSTWVGTSNITTLGTIGTGAWQGTAIGDSYISSASNWNTAHGWGNHAGGGYQSALTFGIANTNAVKIDHASVADDDYAKFTANGLEGRSASELKGDLSLVKGDVGLGNVENTALSTWAGSNNITTLGTLSGNLVFEGSTANDYETTISITDPTADRTITVPNASGTIALGQTVATTSDVTFADLTVTGDLIVSGSQTTKMSETVLIEDNIIVLNSNETGTASANAGIEVERGTGTNVSLRWNESTDVWEYTTDGSSYTAINDAETIRDTTASFIQDGGGITWTHDDSGNTLTGAVDGGSY